MRQCRRCSSIEANPGALICWQCVGELGDEFEVVRSVEDARLAPASVTANALGGFIGETSRSAAVDHYPRSGILRGKILRALAAAGDAGATSDELVARYGWRLYSVKPRLIELREGGWAFRDGSRSSPTGSQVDVYRVSAKGAAAVREELREDQP